MKRLLTVLAALGLVVTGPSYAFHEQGVANCSGCHITHPEDGSTGNEWLLIGVSPSDVCLLCHAQSLGAVLGEDPLLPPVEKGAGNFVFLLEDNLNDAPGGGFDPILGDAAGHNLAAPGHGLESDVRHPTAPGGTFPSNQLGCTSCHDPHGNGNFRLLYGVGPVMEGVATFTNAAPEAIGIGLHSGAESQTNHSAYRRGMSNWCANCHGPYHQGASMASFGHPIDRSMAREVAGRYNRYNGDDDPIGGVVTTAYLPEVPFEDRTTTIDSTAGPSERSRIMCLSCHRAHASSAPAAGRWDFNVALLEQDGDESGSYPIPNPYASPDQGPLCNKCHVPGGEGVAPPLPAADGSGRVPR